jgi:hypothetical protein
MKRDTAKHRAFKLWKARSFSSFSQYEKKKVLESMIHGVMNAVASDTISNKEDYKGVAPLKENVV